MGWLAVKRPAMVDPVYAEPGQLYGWQTDPKGCSNGVRCLEEAWHGAG